MLLPVRTGNNFHISLLAWEFRIQDLGGGEVLGVLGILFVCLFLVICSGLFQNDRILFQKTPHQVFSPWINLI